MLYPLLRLPVLTFLNSEGCWGARTRKVVPQPATLASRSKGVQGAATVRPRSVKMSSQSGAPVRVWRFRDILLDKGNRSVARKLLLYTFLMVTVPVITYYATRRYLFGDLQERQREIASGLSAVLATNVIMGAYVWEALTEDSGAPSTPSPTPLKTD